MQNEMNNFRDTRTQWSTIENQKKIFLQKQNIERNAPHILPLFRLKFTTN